MCVRREKRRRILQTLVWFVVTLVLALFIPDIGRVISMIGGLAACFIFVFPGDDPTCSVDSKATLNSRSRLFFFFFLNNRSVFDPSQALRDRQPISEVSHPSSSSHS